MGSNIEKYTIYYLFERVTKIISHFDGSNNISADCIVMYRIVNVPKIINLPLTIVKNDSLLCLTIKLRKFYYNLLVY